MKCQQVENANKVAEEKYAPIIKKNDEIIAEKDKEIARLKALLNNDGTNCGIPTSKTPINKHKVIPNSREKSGKKIGGQPGHKKHKLEAFKEEEITEKIYHKLEKCPECGGELKKEGEIFKDELNYRVVPIKRRHIFNKYKCTCCNHEVHENIPVRLKEENQYGSEVQSLALSLMNVGNVPVNKVRRIIKGITHNEIDMSEGYIIKLQKRASKELKPFNEDTYKEILKLELIHWEDTVIMVNKKQACLRFYDNEKMAFFKAHEKKNKKGLDEDGILNTLDKETKVVHEYNKVNYNPDYSFTNIECNEHLKRDLQKCHDNTGHEWCLKLKDLIKKTQHDRKELEKESKDSFDNEYLIKFDCSFNDIILDGIEENHDSHNCHYYRKELTLLNRILDYKENYFMWLHDFDIPYDNNLSERGIRGVKSKMKISGQFQNIEYAKYYADIRTYIETCYRNGLNPTDALIELMNGHPFDLKDVLQKE